jgi:hypothetical protein
VWHAICEGCNKTSEGCNKTRRNQDAHSQLSPPAYINYIVRTDDTTSEQERRTTSQQPIPQCMKHLHKNAHASMRAKRRSTTAKSAQTICSHEHTHEHKPHHALCSQLLPCALLLALHGLHGHHVSTSCILLCWLMEHSGGPAQQKPAGASQDMPC